MPLIPYLQCVNVPDAMSAYTDAPSVCNALTPLTPCCNKLTSLMPRLPDAFSFLA